MMTVMSASPVHHLFARRTAALSGLLVLSPPLGSIAAPPRCSGAPLAASGAASGAAPACVKAVTHAAAGGSTCAARRTATRAAHATEQQPAQQEPHTETAPTAIKRRRGRPPKQARPEPPAAPGPPATQLLQDATTSARGADPAPEEREEAAPLTIPLSSETGDEGAAGSAPRAAQPAEARAPHREVASGGVLWPLEDEEDEGLGFDFFDPNVLRWPPPQAPLATVAPSPQQGPESGEVTGRHLGTPGPQHRQRGRSRGEGRRVGTSPSAASPTAAPGGAAAPEPAPAAPPPSGSRWMAGLAQQGGQPPPAEPSAPAPAPAPAAPPVAARAGAGAHEAWWGGYSRGGDARAASVPGAGMADDEAWAREEQGVGGPPALPRQHWWQLPPEEAGAAVVAPSPGQRGGQGAPTLRPGGGLREQQLLSPLQGEVRAARLGGLEVHAGGVLKPPRRRARASHPTSAWSLCLVRARCRRRWHVVPCRGRRGRHAVCQGPARPGA